MTIRILIFTRRHWRGLLAIVVCSVAAEFAIISIPHVQQFYAVETMMWAIRAEDKELEGSQLLNSAIQLIESHQAQHKAVGQLVPLLDIVDARLRMRARYCLMQLKTAPPEVVDALIAAYGNRQSDPVIRAEAAGLLTMLAPQSAKDCGAAAFEKKYVALLRKQGSLGGEEYERRLRELLQ